jgi:hypothetical protein
VKKLLNSKQVNTRLPLHMVQQIKFVAQERGVTDGSIIEAALREFLGKTEQEEILIKKMDRISRELQRMRRENHAMLEVLSSFIRVYLTHERDIPDSEKSNAELKGARRFSRFMDLVASELDKNKPFFDELEQKQFKKEDFVSCS